MVEAHARLAELRVSAIPGWMTEAELCWLYEQAERHVRWSDDVWVEVGCYRGRSTAAVMAGAVPFGTIWCVDTFDGRATPGGEVTTPAEGAAAFCEELRSRGLPIPRILPLESHIAARYIDTATVVFIDGAHDEASVHQDIACWLPKVMQGGMLCGHDYPAYGVGPAVDAAFGDRVQTGPDSIWFVRV